MVSPVREDRQTALCLSAVDGAAAEMLWDVGQISTGLGGFWGVPQPRHGPPWDSAGGGGQGVRDPFPPEEFSFFAQGRNSGLSGLSTWPQWGPFSGPWKTHPVEKGRILVGHKGPQCHSLHQGTNGGKEQHSCPLCLSSLEVAALQDHSLQRL